MIFYFSTRWQQFFFYLLQKQHACEKSDSLSYVWCKNLETNQNAVFFKLQYLTKNLRCEVEFLDMARGPRKY